MTRNRRRSQQPWYRSKLTFLFVSLCIFQHCHSEAQFFDAFTANKRFFGGGGGKGGGGGGLGGGLGGLFGGGGAGGGSGYGAPQKPSYGAPTNKPSYGAPTNKPSYGGGGTGFKNIQLPVPDINFPDPVEFKAGVLRSKGRIASGLLHAKAGILRAGANILAQKANALDKVAQAIPAVKAGLINTLRGVGTGGKGGGGGYGAPQPPSGYGTPQPSYGTPSAPQSYNAPQTQTGYGVPQGPVIGNTGTTGLLSQNQNQQYGQQQVNLNVLPQQNTNSIPLTNNFQPSPPQQQQFQTVQSSLNFGGQQQQTQYGNNQQQQIFNNAQAAPDTYGSPVGNPISTVSPLTFPSNNNNNNNIVVGNTNSGLTSLTGTNNVPNNVQTVQNSLQSLQQNTLQNTLQSLRRPNTNIDSGLNNGPVTNQALTFVSNDIASSNQNRNPFLENLLLQESRKQQQASNLNRNQQCTSNDALNYLLEDLFMGHELIPDVLDKPPLYPLELTYKTIRTYPGMKLTADLTRFKPMLHWPANRNSIYTVVMSNLDINNRKNRTLSEFWHWFVANIPGDSVDEGETIFDHLFPLVLPEGHGDHRFGYFVFEQPDVLDFSEEGGPTDACSPNMSNGRGPFKSTKNFQKKYGLELTAATFVIIDYSDASMEIACEWQKCIGDTINLVSPLKCGT